MRRISKSRFMASLPSISPFLERDPLVETYRSETALPRWTVVLFSFQSIRAKHLKPHHIKANRSTTSRTILRPGIVASHSAHLVAALLQMATGSNKLVVKPNQYDPTKTVSSHTRPAVEFRNPRQPLLFLPRHRPTRINQNRTPGRRPSSCPVAVQSTRFTAYQLAQL